MSRYNKLMSPVTGAAEAEPSPTWRMWLRAFLPAAVAVDGKERWRAVLGACIGIAVTALIGRLLAPVFPDGAWLVAPLGASAVLVFAAPASPLAQPWAVVGGNTVSAMTGVLCALLIPDAAMAGALAVAVAITMMFLLRCLHPPGGAMALLAVLVHASHGQFACAPAAVNSLVLVMVGVAYNTYTGRRYPHMQVAPMAVSGTQELGARFSSRDLDTVLARYNQVLDVSRDDLEALLHAAEMESYRRRTGEVRCSDVMSRELITVTFGDTLQHAWQLLRQHGVKALPVIDMSRRIVGIVTMADFMRHAQIDQPQGMMDKLRDFIRPDGLVHSTKPEVVGQIMTRQVRVVSQDRNITELMPLFTEGGHHHIPIIDGEKRLVGMITQSDFVKALHQVQA